MKNEKFVTWFVENYISQAWTKFWPYKFIFRHIFPFSAILQKEKFGVFFNVVVSCHCYSLSVCLLLLCTYFIMWGLTGLRNAGNSSSSEVPSVNSDSSGGSHVVGEKVGDAAVRYDENDADESPYAPLPDSPPPPLP